MLQMSSHVIMLFREMLDEFRVDDFDIAESLFDSLTFLLKEGVIAPADPLSNLYETWRTWFPILEAEFGERNADTFYDYLNGLNIR